MQSSTIVCMCPLFLPVQAKILQMIDFSLPMILNPKDRKRNADVIKVYHTVSTHPLLLLFFFPTSFGVPLCYMLKIFMGSYCCLMFIGFGILKILTLLECAACKTICSFGCCYWNITKIPPVCERCCFENSR